MNKKVIGLNMLGLALTIFFTVLIPKSSQAATSTQTIKNIAQLNTLKINVPAELTVKSGNEFTVQSNFSSRQKPQVTKKGDQIEVTVKDKKLWDEINHSHSGKLKHKVVITLPQATNPQTVKINSGTLNFKTTTTIHKFQANSNIWDINLNQANFKQSNLKSASGDVNSNDSQIGKTTINSNSGNVYLKNTKTQAIQVESEGGNVLLKKTNSDQPVKINSDSGDIFLENNNLTQVTLKSDGGDIKIRDLLAKDLAFNSGSGDITMENKKIVNYDRLKINSEDGDVQLKNAKINYSKINTDAGDLKLQNVQIKHKDNHTN
ncbi:DUF4097 family beta strand repeat-containing protein [Fructilactobacillus cliffordii]|uniref:DUF4097 domain-containing protein n=1 Tax=Fructilactobacillus cliffordii TaxID=2940299 RepID=A0A9Q8ZSI6_9LACO|nr:DUF4097 family beta strand repeat-containing protein [Fructilactobacillus cliffordii]USS88993.1 DUF4097 domain-containing protein [Fructilactobacillus cliffordii]